MVPASASTLRAYSTAGFVIQALVTACAYSRGRSGVTSDECYRALAFALKAVQMTMEQASADPNDHILASMALLVPFEGVIKKTGIQTRLHVDGLAAMLATRTPLQPVTQLARDIFDFHACENAIVACVQNTLSPFENIPPAYFANEDMGTSNQARLKGLANKLFVRLPRLVSSVRLLRFQSSPQKELLSEALHLSEMLLDLQDSQAEDQLWRNTEVRPPDDLVLLSPHRQSLNFLSVQDYEALAYYWQGRLSVLRVHYRLSALLVSSNQQVQDTSLSDLATITKKMLRLMSNILMTAEYAGGLPLFKHHRMFAHAMVVVWGVMMDIPAVFSHDDNRGSAPELSALVLRKVNAALLPQTDLNAEDMDVAADIFVGGEPQGEFAKLYGL